MKAAYQRAVRLFRQAKYEELLRTTAFEQLDTAAKNRLGSLVAVSLRTLGKFEASRQISLIILFSPISDNRARAKAHHNLAVMDRIQGRYQSALLHLDNAEALAADSHDFASHHLNERAGIMAAQGLYLESIQILRKAISAAESRPDFYARLSELRSTINLGYTLGLAGQIDEGLYELDRASRMEGKDDAVVELAFAEIYAGCLRFKRGESDLGYRMTLNGTAKFEEARADALCAEPYRILGEQCFSRKEYPRALEFAHKGYKLAQKIRNANELERLKSLLEYISAVNETCLRSGHDRQ